MSVPTLFKSCQIVAMATIGVLEQAEPNAVQHLCAIKHTWHVKMFEVKDLNGWFYWRL